MRVQSWYVHNLQIAIPVTVVVGIIVLVIIWAISRCTYRTSIAGLRTSDLLATSIHAGIFRSCRSKPKSVERLPSYPGTPPMNFNPGAMVAQPMYGPK